MVLYFNYDSLLQTMSSIDSNESPNPDEEFETDLMEVERSLLKLKERYKEVKQAQKQKLDLEDRLNEVSPQDTAEVERINEELQQLNIILESDLLTNKEAITLFWEAVRQGLLGEPFWQVVRFGGLGILLGWLLKTWAG